MFRKTKTKKKHSNYYKVHYCYWRDTGSDLL